MEVVPVKTIVQFRIEPEGLFLDLVDQPASVFVNASTGRVLLNEGTGFDRYNGYLLDSSMDVLFWVEELGNGQWHVLLHLDRENVHRLGMTSELKSSVNWTTLANFRIREKHIPAKLSDLTRAEQRLLSRLSGGK